MPAVGEVDKNFNDDEFWPAINEGMYNFYVNTTIL